MNVILDTNIFRQEGLESENMRLLSRLAKREKIKIYIPDIVKREYLTKKEQDFNDELDKFCRCIDKERRYKLFSEEKDKELSEIKEKLKNIKEELHTSLENKFCEWVNENKATIIDLEDALDDNLWLVQNIIDDYFSGNNAFRHPKRREDFPDAFILSEILHILNQKKEFIYIVIKDGAFKRCLDKYDKIQTVDNLDNLLSLDEFKSAFDKLDSESSRIQGIRKFLSSEKCKNSLEGYVYNNDDHILFCDWDNNDISDPDNIIELKTQYVFIDSESKHNLFVDEVEFGNNNYIEKEIYVMQYSFIADVTLEIVADYKEYISFDEHKKKSFEFVEADDEECTLKKKATCRFSGNMTLDISEELTPDALAAHFDYLNNDNNYTISIESKIDKVVIMAI